MSDPTEWTKLVCDRFAYNLQVRAAVRYYIDTLGGTDLDQLLELTSGQLTAELHDVLTDWFEERGQPREMATHFTLVHTLVIQRRQHLGR